MLLAGGVLLLVALALLASNEQAVLAYRAASARHGGQIADVGTQGPEAASDGEVVRVTGTPQVIDPARDRQFGVRVDVPVLWRTVDMFQWREVDIGGQVHYELDWVDHPVDSDEFRQPRGHGNPAALPFGGGTFQAGALRLSGFGLAPAIVRALPGRVDLKPDLGRLPPNMAASFRAEDGILTTSSDPESPQLGDLRVRWQGVPLQEVTVVARAHGGMLEPANGRGDHRGFEVQVGNRPLDEVLPDLPPAPGAVWIWRVLALLVAWGGAHVLLHGVPKVRKDPLSSLTLALVVVCGLGGVLWIVEAPALGGGLMTAALAALAAAAWRLREPSGASRPRRA